MNSDDPPGSRLFVICGNAVEVDTLRASFEPFGDVEYVKKVKEKGVAYIKYQKASSAAHAIEHLHGTALNSGRGPTIKVLLADPPTAKEGHMASKELQMPEMYDPDNTPPRSRLFIVVPKQADPAMIQAELMQFPDTVYCKTDLVALKGIVYLKFTKASSALAAMEQILERSTVCGSKVKCMLAEPKKRRSELSPDHPSPITPGRMDVPMHPETIQGLRMAMQVGVPYQTLLSLAQALSPMRGNFDNNMMLSGSNGPDSVPSSPYIPMTASPSTDAKNNSSVNGLSQQRLFFVVNKSVSSDMISRLFKKFPGMEYCDLKKDHATGKSRGYGFVNYSTAEMASMAVSDLNSTEFPPHSGHTLKVMYAEKLGTKYVEPGVGGSMGRDLTSPMSSQTMSQMEGSMTPLTPGGIDSNNMLPIEHLTGSLSQFGLHRVESRNDFKCTSPSLLQMSSAARELFGSDPCLSQHLQ